MMHFLRAGGTQAEISAKLGQIGCAYQLLLLFKRASCFISLLVIWASTKVHKVIFTSEALGTFLCVNTASQH